MQFTEKIISNYSSSSSSITARLENARRSKSGIYKKLSKRFLSTKRAKRRLMRYSVVGLNLLLVGGIAVFVLNGSTGSGSSGNAAYSAPVVADETIASPLDSISSGDVAVNIARTAGLEESIAVTNQADSLKVNSIMAQADTSVVVKPQIIGSTRRSVEDIRTYITVSGDTISALAARFGITSDSIRWSNSLSGNSLRVGTELIIPPVNGVVYTVARGDTASSIAQKYQANEAQIIAFNNAELSGLKFGQRIVVPNGKKPAAPTYNFSARYGFNGYDYGWCTWYVANKVNMPMNWGNANTWDDRARLTAGWKVSKTPVPGAIAQHNRGSMGHVAFVERVNSDGTIHYSDMNGVAGWNRVGERTASASKFDWYIYR